MKTRDKMYLSILVILIGLFIGSPLSAEVKKSQCVTLRDGSIIKGQILEMNKNTITIKTERGETIIRDFDDIQSVEDFEKAEAPGQDRAIKKDHDVIDMLQKHSWELKPETSFIKYEEPDTMRESGYMAGIGGSYTYHNDVMARAEARYSYGRVDYKNSGTINNIPDYMVEIRGLIGYDFEITRESVITLYAGFGYRYLNDDTSGEISSTGAAGYERESNYYYSPIGIETFSKIGDNWAYGMNFEGDIFWEGKQKSHLSDADPNYNDVDNKQRDGYGFRCSLKFQRTGEHMSFVIEPFYRYWSIKESDWETLTYGGTPIGYAYEPKNNSREVGIIFTLKF
ncbi:MAG: autotransporter outer membrane beta-barrel domain-containing protein [Deltaproteobacteria bacterium]|nr:autotransporter outer membrane beta-barrel domain-containing protein [Deltaproteobacteria bacterium]